MNDRNKDERSREISKKSGSYFDRPEFGPLDENSRYLFDYDTVGISFDDGRIEFDHDPIYPRRLSSYTDYELNYVNSHSAKPQHEESLWEKVKGFVGVGPKGYRRSDKRIHEDVCDLLERHPWVDASEIEVDVQDGIVTLSGSVDSRYTKRMAEDAILDCSGVKDVRNQLNIIPQPQTEKL